jgi:hypothetical protein
MAVVPLSNMIRMLGPSAARLLQSGEVGGLAQTLNRGRAPVINEARQMIGQGPYGGVPGAPIPRGVPSVPNAPVGGLPALPGMPSGGLPASPGLGSAMVGMAPQTIGQMQGGALAGQMLGGAGPNGPIGPRVNPIDALTRMPDTFPNIPDPQPMPQQSNELLPPLARANFQQPPQGQLPSFAQGALPYSSDMGQGGGSLPVFASGMLPNLPLPQGGDGGAVGPGPNQIALQGGNGSGFVNTPMPPQRPGAGPQQAYTVDYGDGSPIKTFYGQMPDLPGMTVNPLAGLLGGN